MNVVLVSLNRSFNLHKTNHMIGKWLSQVVLQWNSRESQQIYKNCSLILGIFYRNNLGVKN